MKSVDSEHTGQAELQGSERIEVVQGASKKRRRRSGWDAPAPTPECVPAPSSAIAVASVAAPVMTTEPTGITIDATAAQKLAFLKAQEILANSGLNVSVGNASHLPANNALANVAKSIECRIYVGSLNYSVTEVEIRAIFGTIGPIRAVDMSFDQLTQRSKGFCFVDFEKASDAQAAMGLNGVEIAGRPVSEFSIQCLFTTKCLLLLQF